MPSSRTLISTCRRLARLLVAPGTAPDLDQRPRGRVLHRVLQQVVDGRHQLPAVAEHPQALRRLAEVDRHLLVLGRVAHPLGGLGHDQVDGHRLPHRVLLRLQAAQVDEVVDHPLDPLGLHLHPPGQAVDDHQVVLGGQGLGQQGQGADRGLELVADVGDEVAPHPLLALLLGLVAEHEDPAHRAPLVVERGGADGRG